jgi:rhodanese-related sulfurtransferase
MKIYCIGFFKKTFRLKTHFFIIYMEIIEIKPTTKMYDIIKHFPSSQRVLFRKYHIGGCSNCGYSLDETLEEVFIKHKKEHLIQDAIDSIYQSQEMDKMFQITPQEFVELTKSDEWKVIDVREPFEREIAVIPGSILLTRELAFEILQNWDKNTKMIFYCHTGIRSLEATHYFYSHGFKNVKNLDGGIDRYAKEIDPSIPLY